MSVKANVEHWVRITIDESICEALDDDTRLEFIRFNFTGVQVGAKATLSTVAIPNGAAFPVTA